MSQLRAVLLVVVVGMAVVLPAQSQKAGRRPLAATDVDAITQLVMLEDTRQFDEAVLTKLLKSAHPEVRRRAVVATGRIVNPAGRALLASARKDDDVDIVATVAFATGQLKDRRRRGMALRVADGAGHAPSGRTRGRAGARQDSHAGRAHGARAVSDLGASVGCSRARGG